jgi:hypothetical protein
VPHKFTLSVKTLRTSMRAMPVRTTRTSPCFAQATRSAIQQVLLSWDQTWTSSLLTNCLILSQGAAHRQRRGLHDAIALSLSIAGANSVRKLGAMVDRPTRE